MNHIAKYAFYGSLLCLIGRIGSAVLTTFFFQIHITDIYIYLMRLAHIAGFGLMGYYFYTLHRNKCGVDADAFGCACSNTPTTENNTGTQPDNSSASSQNKLKISTRLAWISGLVLAAVQIGHEALILIPLLPYHRAYILGLQVVSAFAFAGIARFFYTVSKEKS